MTLRPCCSSLQDLCNSKLVDFFGLGQKGMLKNTLQYVRSLIQDFPPDFALKPASSLHRLSTSCPCLLFSLTMMAMVGTGFCMEGLQRPKASLSYGRWSAT